MLLFVPFKPSVHTFFSLKIGAFQLEWTHVEMPASCFSVDKENWACVKWNRVQSRLELCGCEVAFNLHWSLFLNASAADHTVLLVLKTCIYADFVRDWSLSAAAQEFIVCLLNKTGQIYELQSNYQNIFCSFSCLIAETNNVLYMRTTKSWVWLDWRGSKGLIPVDRAYIIFQLHLVFSATDFPSPKSMTCTQYAKLGKLWF